MLEQTLRHFHCYQEIVTVLIRNGFGFILFEHLAQGGKLQHRLAKFITLCFTLVSMAIGFTSLMAAIGSRNAINLKVCNT